MTTKKPKEDDNKKTSTEDKPVRKKLDGDLTYNSTPGGLERTLRAIITAQKPQKVDAKYIQTTLAVKGGTGSNQVASLKKLGIINSDGSPTEIYDRFRNDNMRSHAAFAMLKKGYAAIFEVNAHAHKASEDEVQNIIAQVTGLDKDDPLIKTIHSCYDKVRNFIDPSINVYETPTDDIKGDNLSSDTQTVQSTTNSGAVGTIGLNYQINIVLPQSGNIETYDMIFRSLRNNLLDWNN